MVKTTYEEYKYVLQDVSRIYLGCKYSFQESAWSVEMHRRFANGRSGADSLKRQ